MRLATLFARSSRISGAGLWHREVSFLVVLALVDLRFLRKVLASV